MNAKPDSNGKKILDVINNFASGAIFLQANPSLDAIAAACSLYLGLQKINKPLPIVCSNPVDNKDIIGADTITDKMVSGGNNLVISFPYKDGSIDKVDYSIDNDQFNLVLVPSGGTANPVDPKDVRFTYSGGKVEYIIAIDIPNLNSIGKIYTDNQADFQGKNIINIDRHLINNSYGTINVIDKTISSSSELVLDIMREMGLEIDKDVATNIYYGIASATNIFTSYSVNLNTHEAAAFVLKKGAVKKSPPPQTQKTAAPGSGFGGQSGFPPLGQNMGRQPQMNQFPQNNTPPQPIPGQNNQQQQQNKQSQSNPGQNQNNAGNQNQQQPQQQSTNNQNKQQKPQDWLRPKLFKGNN